MNVKKGLWKKALALVLAFALLPQTPVARAAGETVQESAETGQTAAETGQTATETGQIAAESRADAAEIITETDGALEQAMYWLDGNNEDGIRPEIFRNTGEITVAELDAYGTLTFTLTDEDGITEGSGSMEQYAEFFGADTPEPVGGGTADAEDAGKIVLTLTGLPSEVTYISDGTSAGEADDDGTPAVEPDAGDGVRQESFDVTWSLQPREPEGELAAHYAFQQVTEGTDAGWYYIQKQDLTFNVELLAGSEAWAESTDNLKKIFSLLLLHGSGDAEEAGTLKDMLAQGIGLEAEEAEGHAVMTVSGVRKYELDGNTKTYWLTAETGAEGQGRVISAEQLAGLGLGTEEGDYLTLSCDNSRVDDSGQTAETEKLYPGGTGIFTLQGTVAVSISGAKVWKNLPEHWTEYSLPYIELSLTRYVTGENGEQIWDLDDDGATHKKVAAEDLYTWGTDLDTVDVPENNYYRFTIEFEDAQPRYDDRGRRYTYTLEETDIGGVVSVDGRDMSDFYHSEWADEDGKSVLYNTYQNHQGASITFDKFLYLPGEKNDEGIFEPTAYPTVTFTLYGSGDKKGVYPWDPTSGGSGIEYFYVDQIVWSSAEVKEVFEAALESEDAAVRAAANEGLIRGTLTFDDVAYYAPNGWEHSYAIREETLQGYNTWVREAAGEYSDQKLAIDKVDKFIDDTEKVADSDTPMLRKLGPDNNPIELVGQENVYAGAFIGKWDAEEQFPVRLTGTISWDDEVRRPEPEDLDLTLTRRAEQPGLDDLEETIDDSAITLTWSNTNTAEWTYTIVNVAGSDILRHYSPVGTEWEYQVKETVPQGCRPEQAGGTVAGKWEMKFNTESGQWESVYEIDKLTNRIDTLDHLTAEKIWGAKAEDREEVKALLWRTTADITAANYDFETDAAKTRIKIEEDGTVSEAQNEAEQYVITLNAENGWTSEVKNLPRYLYRGETGMEMDGPYSYFVTESTTGGESPEDGGLKVIYSYEEDKEKYSLTTEICNIGRTDVSGTVTWKDNGDAYGTRPDMVALTLERRTEQAPSWQPVDSDFDGKALELQWKKDGAVWTYTYKNLPYADDEGHTYIYRAVQQPVKIEGENTCVYEEGGSYKPICDKTQLNFTNSLTGTTCLTVNLNWLDREDETGRRPESASMKLYHHTDGAAEDTFVKELTVTGDSWICTADNLPMFDSEGKAFTYTIGDLTAEDYALSAGPVTKETENSGQTDARTVWKVTADGTMLTGFPVEIVWGDVSPEDRGTVHVGLYRSVDGSEPEPVLQDDALQAVELELSSDNGWSGEFSEKFPAYTEENQRIVYSVRQETIGGQPTEQKNYRIVIETEPQETDSFQPGYRFINIRRMDLAGTVTWQGDEEALEKRPQTVAMQLYRSTAADVDGANSGTDEGWKLVTETDMTEEGASFGWEKDGNVWTYTYEDLPAADDSGVKYTYDVRSEAPEGYVQTADEPGDGGGRDFVNLLNPEIAVSASVTWKDNGDAYGTRPDMVVLTLEYRTDQSESWTEVTEDYDGQAVQPEWEKDGSVWTCTWRNLSSVDGKGHTYIYRTIQQAVKVTEANTCVYEEGVSYETACDETQLNYVNTLTGRTRATVNYSWQDGDDETGRRPETVSMKLHGRTEGAAEDAFVKELTVTGDSWICVADDLPMFDSEGKVFTYTITELMAEGYESSISSVTKETENSGQTDSRTVWNISAAGTLLTGFPVQIVWGDVSPADRETVRVALYRSVDGGEPEPVLRKNSEQAVELELSEENGWQGEFREGCRAYTEEGQRIVYSVREETIGGQPAEQKNYRIVIETEPQEEDPDQPGYRVINIRRMDLGGTVTWQGDEDAVDERPQTVSLQLYRSTAKASGKSASVDDAEWVPVPDADMTAEGAALRWEKDGNIWTYTYDDLPAADDFGVKYTYDVRAEAPEGYVQLAAEPGSGGGRDFVNLLNPETAVSGMVIWEDKENVSGARPEMLTLSLYRQTESGSPQTVEMTPAWTCDEGNVWRYTFAGLPTYDDQGRKYTYRVEGADTPGYDTYYDSGQLNVTKRMQGGLELTKTVSGTAGDLQKEFHFTITLSDTEILGRLVKAEDINGQYGDLTFEDGVAGTVLTHGQSAAAEGLPAGMHYQIIETEDGQDGYTTEKTGETGVIPVGDVAEALFNSHKDLTEPEDPEEPDEPTGPEEPGDTDEPAGPEEPGDTDEPAGPEEPGDTDEPAGPEEPGDTDEPAGPEEPGDTDEPAGPEEPGDTDEPAEPEEPGDTDKPAGPEEPGNTDNPAGPEDSSDPGTGDNGDAESGNSDRNNDHDKDSAANPDGQMSGAAEAVAKTGDDFGIFWYVVACIASAAGIMGCLFLRGKRK